ncbi:MAG TPA: helix-turn-helix domain-containing protein [Capillimicrobium sp.]|nr:helix-turn-helix domain-containing protein [Capillimicrobium sp.]
MMSNTMDLPVIGSEPRERADAARNRRRILTAAQRLFAERGVECVSMDAIAAEAGVGKGTLFRRFGDRASLALAVLDESDRALQDAMISGPPPLGPGAPPRERLIAFGHAWLDWLEANHAILLNAETTSAGAWIRSEPRAVRWLHARTLLADANPELDADYAADVALAPLDAQLFCHQRFARGMQLERLKDAYEELVCRLLASP